MKLNIYQDEMYPVYYIYENNSNLASFEQKVEIPDEIYDEIKDTFEEFRLMQEVLKDYYQTAKREDTSWSTTNSSSATTTSSTRTF